MRLPLTQECDAARQNLHYFAKPSEHQVDVTALLLAIDTAYKNGVEMAQIQKAETKLAAATKNQKASGIAV